MCMGVLIHHYREKATQGLYSDIIITISLGNGSNYYPTRMRRGKVIGRVVVVAVVILDTKIAKSGDGRT